MIVQIEVFLWFILSSISSNTKLMSNTTRDLDNFKKNHRLFLFALSQERFIEQFKRKEQIIEYNLNSKNVSFITIVTDPCCYACKDMHKVVDSILAMRDDKVVVSFIFLTKKEIETNSGFTVAAHILSLPAQIQHEALSNWFKHYDYSVWKSLYPIDISLEAKTILQEQLKWARTNNILYTPYILVNSRPLPQPWEIDDIIYLMKHIK